MGRALTEQELADFLFDRIIINCATCPDTQCLRVACQEVAAELLKEAEIFYKMEPVSDGGA